MFNDRRDAGRQLAAEVAGVVGDDSGDWIVAGVPRGGIPVAAVVSSELRLPLCAVAAVKIRAPWNPELAIGAVAEEGIRIIDRQLVERTGTDEGQIDKAAHRAAVDLQQRGDKYGRAVNEVADRPVILVDDGAATGLTTRAAAQSLRKARAHKLLIALPVASRQAAEVLRQECDRLLVVSIPHMFMAVSQFYHSFPPVDDGEVLACLGEEE